MAGFIQEEHSYCRKISYRFKKLTLILFISNHFPLRVEPKSTFVSTTRINAWFSHHFASVTTTKLNRYNSLYLWSRRSRSNRLCGPQQLREFPITSDKLFSQYYLTSTCNCNTHSPLVASQPWFRKLNKNVQGQYPAYGH